MSSGRCHEDDVGESEDPGRSHGAGGPDGAKVRVVLQEVLLHLGQDVLAIGVLPESGEVRSDLVHQDLPLTGLGHVDHLLDDVVGVLVLHHDVQGRAGTVRVGGADLLYEEGPLLPGGVLDALLHDVAGELVLGEVQHLSSHSGNWKYKVYWTVLDQLDGILIGGVSQNIFRIAAVILCRNITTNTRPCSPILDLSSGLPLSSTCCTT